MSEINEYMNKLAAYDNLAKIKGFKKDPNLLKAIRDNIYYKSNGNKK
jgi:hypothetical protein